jgi:hypothetical protein
MWEKRSRWQICLRRVSVAALFLGFRVLIPQGYKCLSVWYAVQVGVSATGRSLVQGSPTNCICISHCDRRNNNPLHLVWVDTRGQIKKNEKMPNSRLLSFRRWTPRHRRHAVVVALYAEEDTSMLAERGATWSLWPLLEYSDVDCSVCCVRDWSGLLRRARAYCRLPQTLQVETSSL